MCTPDGMIFDDGVTLRLDEDRYFMTTTTGGAAKVLDWLEEWLQTEWPELDVHCTSVTEQWTTVAVVGPEVPRRHRQARAGAGRLGNEAFPFMTFRETTLASGMPARICRISFSGELAFEINVPAWYGLNVWEDVAAAGAEFDITPYGTETMHVLRAEKGYPIVGQDTDGTRHPAGRRDGLGGLQGQGLHRQALLRPRRHQRERPQAPGRRAAGGPDASGCRRAPSWSTRASRVNPAVRPGPDAGPRDLQLPQRGAGPLVRAWR